MHKGGVHAFGSSHLQSQVRRVETGDGRAEPDAATTRPDGPDQDNVGAGLEARNNQGPQPRLRPESRGGQSGLPQDYIPLAHIRLGIL